MTKLLEFLVVILLIPPQGGVRIELSMYRLDGSVWLEERVGECVSDANGRCEIRGRAEAWRDGLMRGVLNVQDYGLRPVIWRGENYIVEIFTNEPPHVDSPYSYLSPSSADAPVIQNVPRGGLLSIIGAAFFLILTFVIYQRAKRA